MIIKLIQPKMSLRPMDTMLKTRMAPSLALLTIANVIPIEHKVIIENENIEVIDFCAAVDLVGITVTVDTMPSAITIAQKFRDKGVKVVAGGIHITCDPESAKKYFDSLCIGIAERSWPQIIKDTKNGTLKKVYDDNLNIKSEEIAGPNYDLIDHSKYLYTNIITTSRGCPFKCDFCYNSCKAYKNIYVTRNIPAVIEEIIKLNNKRIMFIDDNFIGDPTWTENFLYAIKSLKIKWSAAVSANIGQMPDLLDLMKDTGCQSLFIGIESTNQSSLSDVHKIQNDIGNYERLVEQIHKRGIMINASFVFGLDGDDKNTFRQTLDWIVAHRIETLTCHILTPYPGTQLHAKLQKEGRITDFDLSHYNTAHVVYEPKNMTAQELYEGYLWIYKEAYTFQNLIRRLPKSKNQWVPYLAFNFFYRKFGKFTEILCTIVSFKTIGKIAEYLSYKIK